jgi:glycogen(starch) synthase
MLGWEYPPFKVGGLATHCFGLTRSLADNGVSIDFYMPRTNQIVRSNKENLKIIQVGETSVFPYDRPNENSFKGTFVDAVSHYNSLLAQKVKGTYDLIHCHDWLTMNAAMTLKKSMGIPLVLTVHSTEYDRSGWLNPNQWFIDLERTGMRYADRIIAVSEFTKKIIVEKYGVNSEKIEVIHNAVYPITEGKKQKIVLFLGRLTIQKGPEFFLSAAKKVLQYEDCKFVIAGTGEMLPWLIDKAVHLGISSHVIFTGALSDAEVRHIYGIASVYVMPSVSEPFGITALEAISAGTPTIVSKTAGVSEALHHCLRVDFWDVDEMANKIISILRYQPLRLELAKNGKHEITLFTWNHVAEQTKHVYQSVISKNRHHQKEQ